MEKKGLRAVVGHRLLMGRQDLRSHPGLTGIAGSQNIGHDAALFSSGPGTVAECGQAAGWGDWGKAGVGWAGGVIEMGSRLHLQVINRTRI